MKLSYRKMQDLTVDEFERNRICVFTQLRFDAKGPRRLPQKLNHALTKTGRRIASELKDFDDTKEKSMLEYIKTDSKGQMKPDKDGNAVFKSKKAEKDYEAAIQELLDTKVEVDVHQIHESVIEKMDAHGGLENHLYEALADIGMIAGAEPDEEEEEDESDTDEEASDEDTPS